MEIRDIKIYNLPFDMESDNRVIIDNPSLIEKFKIADIDKSKVSIQNNENYLNFTITINHTRGDKVNYLYIDTDLYDKPIYCFLNIISITSNVGTIFQATMDVIATYGKILFEGLVNEELNFERKHWDRYIIDGNKAKLNTECSVLYTNEFKTGNTEGEKRYFEPGELTLPYIDNYDPAKVKGPVSAAGGWTVNANDTTGKNPLKGTIYNVTGIQTDLPPDFNTEFWQYVIINRLGASSINAESGKNPLEQMSQQYMPFINVGGLFTQDFIIAPLHNGGVIPIPDSGNAPINTADSFEYLQGGKIINTILSPVPLMGEMFSANFNDQSPEWASEKPPYSAYVNSQVWQGGITGSDVPTLVPQPLYFEYLRNNQQWVSTVFGVNFNFKNEGQNKMFFNTYLEMPLPLNIEDRDKLEIGMLTSGIANMQFVYNQQQDNPIKINTANYLKDPTVEIHPRVYSSGVSTLISIGNYMFASYQDSLLLDTQSAAGATYATQNANTIANQRTRANLDVASAGLGVADKASSLGTLGGVLGAIFHPVHTGIGIAQSVLALKKAENAKEAINAHIRDAYNGPPSVHLSNGSILNGLNQGSTIANRKSQYLTKYTLEIRTPNDFITKRIINYWNQFGYAVNSYLKFTEVDWYKTRIYWDYFMISNLLDVINPTKIKVSPFVLDEFNRLMKTGLRLMHTDHGEAFSMDLSRYNVERSLGLNGKEEY